MNISRNFMKVFNTAVAPAILLGLSSLAQAHHDLDKPQSELETFEGNGFTYKEVLAPSIHLCKPFTFESVSCSAGNEKAAKFTQCQLLNGTKVSSDGTKEVEHLEVRSSVQGTRQDLMIEYLEASMMLSSERWRILDSDSPRINHAFRQAWKDSNGDSEVFSRKRENIVEAVMQARDNPNALYNYGAKYTTSEIEQADIAMVNSSLDCEVIGQRADAMVKAALEKLQNPKAVDNKKATEEAPFTIPPTLPATIPEPMTYR